MSQSYTTSNYMDRLSLRLPIGMGDSELLYLVDLAWKQVVQLAPFTFMLEETEVTIGSDGYFDLPTDFETARPAVLRQISTSAGAVLSRLVVPFVAVEALSAQIVEGATIPVGLYSGWTFFQRSIPVPPDAIVERTGWVVPAAALPTAPAAHYARFLYHKQPADLTGNEFLPLPGLFEWLVVDMAESEARRVYGCSGVEAIEARVQKQLQSLLDGYRTTRATLAGLSDQMAQVQTRQARQAG